MFAADTLVEVIWTAGPRRGNAVPICGGLVVKLKVADAIVTLGLSGAPMDTVGVVFDVVLPDVVLPDVVLPDVVLPDVVLPDVVLLAVVVLVAGAVPPPPPPEQAVKAARQAEQARRNAPFRTIPMEIP